jgi:hypothetical protein
MPDQETFKGPGHWRSQAEAARQPAGVFGMLADLARTLADRHQLAAESRVHAAEKALKDDDTETAAMALRAAARNCGPNCKAEADGLRAIADELPESSAEAEPKQPARPAEDTHMHDALP